MSGKDAATRTVTPKIILFISLNNIKASTAYTTITIGCETMKSTVYLYISISPEIFSSISPSSMLYAVFRLFERNEARPLLSSVKDCRNRISADSIPIKGGSAILSTSAPIKNGSCKKIPSLSYPNSICVIFPLNTATIVGSAISSKSFKA